MPYRLITTLAVGLALLVSVTAHSHESGKGRHGGWRIDVGNYHTEVVVDGTPNVVIHLSDADDKPIAAKGFKATAIFIIGGKSQRFELAPSDGSKLVGTAPAAVKPGVKGVVRLTEPGGTTAQGKF